MSINKSYLFLFLFVLSVSVVSAAQIDFIKNSSNFSQGETLIAKVSANFVENPTRDNVFFYRGNVRIPIDYEVLNIDDDFYIYASLIGKAQGNYSIALENVVYMNGIQESTENIVKNFIISSTMANFAIIGPAVFNIQSPPGSFSVSVQNLNSNQITISIDTSNKITSQNTLTLKSGEIKIIDLQADQNTSFSEQIKLLYQNTEYSLPVFVNSNTSTSNNETTSNEQTSTNEESFRFEPDSIRLSMATNSKAKRIIYLINNGDIDIKDLTILVPLQLDAFVTIDYEKDIAKNSSEKVEIEIISDGHERNLKGKILAKTKNTTEELNFEVEFIKDFVPTVNEETQQEAVLTTCVQLQGNVCSANYTCSGKTADLKDGVCCLKPSVCETVKEGGSTSKLIGWALVLIVILLVLWFFKRYRRVRPQVNLFNPGRRY